MFSTVQALRSELRRLAQRHDPLRATGEWAEAWKLIDQTGEARLHPSPVGRSEPVPHFAGGERRSPVCPECGGTDFRHVEWTEHVRRVYGFDAGNVLHVEGLSRDVPEAAFGEHLWCEDCDTSFELPLEVDYD